VLARHNAQRTGDSHSTVRRRQWRKRPGRLWLDHHDSIDHFAYRMADPSKAKVKRWKPIIAATRLNEKIPGEAARVLTAQDGIEQAVRGKR
jgi:hypothetical protein